MPLGCISVEERRFQYIPADQPNNLNFHFVAIPVLQYFLTPESELSDSDN
jgi:hypothetical protein